MRIVRSKSKQGGRTKLQTRDYKNGNQEMENISEEFGECGKKLEEAGRNKNL